MVAKINLVAGFGPTGRTVTDAKDDGDNNIYVQGADGKRTGEIIGQTENPLIL